MEDNFGGNNKNCLEFISKINKGSFGEVYKGNYLKSGKKTIVAIKKIESKYDGELLDHNIIREIFNLKNLNHVNIIKLIDVIIDKPSIFLVLEYVDMDLYDFIYKANKNISKELIKSILYKILKGINYLHSKNLIHRDLKLKNILISNEGDIVKIGDFGLSRKITLLNPTYSKRVGTLQYMAPEMLLNFSNYSYAIDIWSIGCIFYELIFKKKLFTGNHYDEVLKSIEKILGSPTNENWPNIESIENYTSKYHIIKKGIFINKEKGFNTLALDLFNNMIIYDPNKRISAESAIKHVSRIFILLFL